MSPTDIIAWIDRPEANERGADGWDWAEAATGAWLAMAERLGVSAEVVSRDVVDASHDAAIVEVDGRAYVLTLREDTVGAYPAAPVDD